MLLTLYHDKPDSSFQASRFRDEKVLERLRRVDAQARTKGLSTLRPADEPLIGLGMEVSPAGEVTKNSYGVFDLSWQSAEHPEWPAQIVQEVEEVRQVLRRTQKTLLRFLLWVGMGGSAEDKLVYQAAGLLNRGPRVYVLDSTDPVKLQAILEDIQRRTRLGLPAILKSMLVVGMALGMTSYEPVVNLQTLADLYEKNGIDGRAHFLYLTMTGSLLDQFAAPRGFRRVPLQPDEGNSTSGRHSSPLTRGSLYPLALARQDLRSWMEGTQLKDEEIEAAWRLAAFLHTQARQGCDKITLLLPKGWTGAAIWTKQDFEESLGKSESFGLKLVVDEKVKLANYRSPKDAGQDRVFFVVQRKGESHPDAAKITLLRRAGYPVAVVTVNGPLSRYMQFIHYTVFGIAYLEGMNFVMQPSVELYKAITSRVYEQAKAAGGLTHTPEWQRLCHGARATWRGRVTLHYDLLPAGLNGQETIAPRIYAHLLRSLRQDGKVTYGELTYFGDLRYHTLGRRLRKLMDRAAERVFRNPLKMPVDVYEGPAMNHSYHEMIIGHGGCFSTVILNAQEDGEAATDYHRAQFLATQLALAERGRAVVAITLKDLGEETLAALDEFFRQAATAVKC